MAKHFMMELHRSIQMSDWNPKQEWRRLKLMTEARARYEEFELLREVSADWDTGYDQDGDGDNDAERQEQEKKKKKEEEEADAKKAKVKTWGDLQDVIQAITHQKHLAALSKRGGEVGKAADTIMSYFPGSNIVKIAQVPGKWIKMKKKPWDTMKALMKTVQPLEDAKVEKPAGGFLDAFKIDDGYQQITDDRLENKFIKDITAEFAEKPRDEEIPADMDINDWYEDWLSKNIGETAETVTGAESDTKFTDINAISPDAKSGKAKKAVQKVSATLGGTLKGFLGLT